MVRIERKIDLFESFTPLHVNLSNAERDLRQCELGRDLRDQPYLQVTQSVMGAGLNQRAH